MTLDVAAFVVSVVALLASAAAARYARQQAVQTRRQADLMAADAHARGRPDVRLVLQSRPRVKDGDVLLHDLEVTNQEGYPVDMCRITLVSPEPSVDSGPGWGEWPPFSMAAELSDLAPGQARLTEPLGWLRDSPAAIRVHVELRRGDASWKYLADVSLPPRALVAWR